ncbi:MAG TPA: serine hydrolase domain-containing protein [Candidatus Glassbacteria bacterium]|nr:serine hydrolase domain-containing protein [Candidatus Glassbacteria bacterium]
MNNEKRTEILGKDQEKITERIKRIENAIPQATLKDGRPFAIWDDVGTITERMNAFNVPGISIAVINNFELEWLKCFGIKDVKTKEEVTLDTLFEGGSTAKAITAAVLLQAVEENIIDLDEPVNDKLKGWKIPENEYTKETAITLRHLLTHTSGINRPDSMFGYEQGSEPSIEQVLRGEYPAKNDPVEVQFTPGTDHQYSNFGYVIIQKYLEDVFGENFSKIVEDKLFKPLDMTSSQFGYPSNKNRDKAIVPHNEKGEAEESGIHPSALAMGGLVSTPRDLGKFIIELIKAYNGQKSKYLSTSLVQKMFSSEVKLEPSKWFGFTDQGLGMYLIQGEKELFFTHPGTNMPGATCLIFGNPTTGQGAILMANGIQGELVNLQLIFSIVKEYNWNLWQ